MNVKDICEMTHKQFLYILYFWLTFFGWGVDKESSNFQCLGHPDQGEGELQHELLDQEV